MGLVWKKLWVDRLLASPKYTQLGWAEKGIYFELLLRADKEGKLLEDKENGRPLTIEGLAKRVLHIRYDGLPAFRRRFEKLLKIGLIKQENGVYVLSNHDRLANPQYRKRNKGGDDENRLENRLPKFNDYQDLRTLATIKKRESKEEGDNEKSSRKSSENRLENRAKIDYQNSTIMRTYKLKQR